MLTSLPSHASRARWRFLSRANKFPAYSGGQALNRARYCVRGRGGIYLDGCTFARHAHSLDFSLLWKFADAPAEIYDRRNLRPAAGYFLPRDKFLTQPRLFAIVLVPACSTFV